MVCPNKPIRMADQKSLWAPAALWSEVPARQGKECLISGHSTDALFEVQNMHRRWKRGAHSRYHDTHKLIKNAVRLQRHL